MLQKKIVIIYIFEIIVAHHLTFSTTSIIYLINLYWSSLHRILFQFLQERW